MIAYLIGPVELRLGVDDGGRVLVQRRHELRQARGLLGEGLLGRGTHPATAASPSAGAARSLANHLSDKLTGASLKFKVTVKSPSLTRARHTGPPARAKLAYESIVVGRSGDGDVVGEGVHATPHGVAALMISDIGTFH